MLKNLKGSPFQFFGIVTLARHLVHFFECVIFFEYSFQKFSIFEYCKRKYLTLGSIFAIFEPWIWRRLGPVPACCLFSFTFVSSSLEFLGTILQIRVFLCKNFAKILTKKSRIIHDCCQELQEFLHWDSSLQYFTVGFSDCLFQPSLEFRSTSKFSSKPMLSQSIFR